MFLVRFISSRILVYCPGSHFLCVASPFGFFLGCLARRQAHDVHTLRERTRSPGRVGNQVSATTPWARAPLRKVIPLNYRETFGQGLLAGNPTHPKLTKLLMRIVLPLRHQTYPMLKGHAIKTVTVFEVSQPSQACRIRQISPENEGCVATSLLSAVLWTSTSPRKVKSQSVTSLLSSLLF